MNYADSWYCNENCLYEYLKENENELAEILNESEIINENNDNNDEENNNEDEGDFNYDPMEDF